MPKNPLKVNLAQTEILIVNACYPARMNIPQLIQFLNKIGCQKIHSVMSSFEAMELVRSVPINVCIICETFIQSLALEGSLEFSQDLKKINPSLKMIVYKGGSSLHSASKNYLIAQLKRSGIDEVFEETQGFQPIQKTLEKWASPPLENVESSGLIHNQLGASWRGLVNTFLPRPILLRGLIGMVILTGIVLYPLHRYLARDVTANLLPYGGTLMWGTVNPPAVNTGLNPILVRTSVAMSVFNLIFDPLVRINSRQEIVPGLAQSWEVSEDGLVYTFHLHQGVRFHNGVELTAADVKFTYDQVMDPKNRSPRRHKVELVERWEVLDKYTVRMKLKKPFESILAQLNIGIIPQHLLEKQDISTTPFNQHPIGTGPFRLKKWDPRTKQINLEKNKNYFLGRPYLNQITIKAYEDSAKLGAAFMRQEIDLVKFIRHEDYKTIQEDPAFKAYDLDLGFQAAIAWSLNDPIVSDLEIRRALAYSINQEDILKNIPYQGIVSVGPFYPYSDAFNKKVQPFGYQPQQAIKILEKKGWRFHYTFKKEHFGYDEETAHQNVMTLIEAITQDLGVSPPALPSIQAALQWLNEGIAPYRLFSRSHPAGELSDQGQALIAQIEQRYGRPFFELSEPQLRRLAREPEGEYLKRLILKQLYPWQSPDAKWPSIAPNSIRQKEGKELILTVLVSRKSPLFQKVAKVIHQHLFQVGIGLKVRLYNGEQELTPEYLDQHKPQGWLRFFYGDFVNGGDDEILGWGLISKELEELWHYENQAVDQLFERARSLQNREEKLKIYHQIHELAYADQPACFLFYLASFHAVSGKFKNTDDLFAQSMPDYTIRDWHLAETVLRAPMKPKKGITRKQLSWKSIIELLRLNEW